MLRIHQLDIKFMDLEILRETRKMAIFADSRFFFDREPIQL